MLRKLFTRKDRSRKGKAGSADPTVPPHPQPQSESFPQILQNSDGGVTSETPSGSGSHLPVPNVNESKPLKLSSYTVDPTAAYENKADWKSTLYASAGLAIDILKESSDVFTPLKSVAGGLSAILKNCEQTMANRETIESLVPRLEGLAESLSAPAPEGEIKEIERRQALKRKLDNALRALEPLAERGKVTGFLNNVKDAETLIGLADDVRDAMMDYQIALQQDIYHKNHQLIDKVDLSLLKGMDHTADAGFLAGNRQACLKGTRRDVLLQIEQWLTNEKDQRLFWLNGLAGTGKSTIAQTFAEISFADGKLGASFFCSRDFEDRSNLQAIFPTLAFQLAHRYPQFRKQLIEVLRANHDVERESLSSQLEKLIVRPFKETQIPTLIIIDALDECKDKEPASALLSVLSRYVHEIPGAKFFITGRPELQIREGFRLKSLLPITDVLKLHDVKRSSVDEDIKLYLRTHLTHIRETRSDCEFPKDWPYSYDINFLCKKAGGLFIYASTVVKFVASKYHLPTERLDLIILRSKSTTHEGGIDLLYTQILELAFQDADPGEQELYSRFKNVVGAVLLVSHPLSRKTLSTLLRNCGTPSHIATTLRFLHSLLNVPDSEDEPIRVFHKSFPDFLTDRTRCKDDRFFIDLAVHHENVLFSCLDLMKKRLKKNLCDLDDYAVLDEIKDLPARREKCIGSSLEYACWFWTRHLASVPAIGPHVKRVQQAIEEFFAKRLLCWIEVLSIVEHLGTAVYAINEIRQWYISAGITTCEQADDSERLILEYFDAICHSPSHIYHSALPLSPSSSWVRTCYKEEVVGKVKVLMGLPDRWDSCSRTIFLEGDPTAFAYWGDIIAVGIDSNVALLELITGSRVSALYGHPGRINSLAFSLDGTLLASATEKVVNLWDVQTGGLIGAFGDDTPVASAAISPNGLTIALGTTTGVIHLWSVRTGECHPIETGQASAVTHLSFSPIDSQRFLSLSNDGPARQWDVEGNQIGVYHETARMRHLAYSPDGTRFILGGWAATVRDSESGEVVVTFQPPSGKCISRCCFSPDGRFVACSIGSAVYVWDITVSWTRLVGHLVGHSGPITFITFPSSLISGSCDESVKLWQSSGFLADPVTADHTAALRGPAPIVSVNLFAEDGLVVTSDESGIVKTLDLITGKIQSTFSTPAQGRHDTHLGGNTTLIIIWCTNEEKEYHVWDVSNGKLLRKFTTTLPYFEDLRISGDGSKVFGTGLGRIEALSTQTGENIGQVEYEIKDQSSFVVHGSRVGIGHSRESGWDFGGQKVSDFGEFPDRPRLDLVNWSEGYVVKPRWIEDTVTKRQVFRLPERCMKADTQIECDGRYLLLWSNAGEVVIVDLDPVCPR